MGASVAVEHTDDFRCCRVRDQCPGVVFGVAGMYDDGLPCFGRELDLRGESRPLCFTGRVVVVIVEAALADRHGVAAEPGAKLGNVAPWVEGRGVVGVYARGGEYKPGMLGRTLRRDLRRRERLTDADDGDRARFAGA
jgi:hypothetical protein